MVVEHAEPTIEPGREQQLQNAFGQARKMRAEAHGSRWAEPLRCHELGPGLTG
ncbi:hypothetical protein ACTWJ8_02545 [Streptomyces sp. SDT5-1]|uniref:hypothetical protein n=1 Tax=Streptomyces sp. SDT5-1 TaxID=3406418 RepID=UPI003FD1D3EC